MNQDAVAIPGQTAETITIVTQMRGAMWGELLAVRLADAGQVDQLLEIGAWLERAVAGAPHGPRILGLSALVDLPGTCAWRIPDPPWDWEDLPDGGLVVTAEAVEPPVADNAWGDTFRVYAGGELDIEEGGDAWAWVNLNAIREALR